MSEPMTSCTDWKQATLAKAVEEKAARLAKKAAAKKQNIEDHAKAIAHVTGIDEAALVFKGAKHEKYADDNFLFEACGLVFIAQEYFHYESGRAFSIYIRKPGFFTSRHYVYDAESTAKALLKLKVT